MTTEPGRSSLVRLKAGGWGSGEVSGTPPGLGLVQLSYRSGQLQVSSASDQLGSRSAQLQVSSALDQLGSRSAQLQVSSALDQLGSRSAQLQISSALVQSVAL